MVSPPRGWARRGCGTLPRVHGDKAASAPPRRERPWQLVAVQEALVLGAQPRVLQHGTAPTGQDESITAPSATSATDSNASKRSGGNVSEIGQPDGHTWVAAPRLLHAFHGQAADGGRSSKRHDGMTAHSPSERFRLATTAHSRGDRLSTSSLASCTHALGGACASFASNFSMRSSRSKIASERCASSCGAAISPGGGFRWTAVTGAMTAVPSNCVGR